MNIPIPFWVMRRLVTKYPWLLSEPGRVTRSKNVGCGEFLFKFGFSAEDRQKYRELEAKRAAEKR